jgi:hypothetical protein
MMLLRHFLTAASAICGARTCAKKHVGDTGGPMTKFLTMRALLAAVCIVLFAAAATSTATAANTGRVVVTVTSSGGQPIAGASVSVAGSPWSYNASTDARGSFTFGAVEPGTYIVMAQARGFYAMRFTGIFVQSSQTAALNFILAPMQH